MTAAAVLVALVIATFFAGLWWYWRSHLLSDLRRLDNLLTEVSEGREPYRVDFHDHVRFQPIADSVEKLACRHRDARDELHLEAVNLRTILRSMDEGVVVVDTDQTIRFVNPAFRTLFAGNVDPVNESFTRVLPERSFEEIIHAVVESGQAQESDVSIDGERSTRHFSVSAIPLRDAQARPGVVMIFRDISRLRKLEDVRKEFVGNVSHELRTPLSIFQGYLETLLECPNLSAEEAHPMLLVMNKHSRRLNALVEDLLILARLESRDEQLELMPVDIDKFIQESVANWSLRCTEKKISLRADVAPGIPPVQLDAFRFEQVMSNLIDNAIKYTNTGGNAIVRAALSGDHVEIRVEDTGLGIPADDLPRIFERFYRADKARSREHGGTGLGLSIVKHIVLAHGGTVHAESVQGKGTSIIIRLPLLGPAASDTSTA